jgi:hypothetical protein
MDARAAVAGYMQGKIQIDPMITHVMPLNEINDGFELMKRGESIRGVVTFLASLIERNPFLSRPSYHESGVSSTPRPIASAAGASGILGHPPEPVIGRRESADPVAGDDGGKPF